MAEFQDKEFSKVVRTNAGMCALWQPESLRHLGDFDAWEDWADDNAKIEEMIRQGFLVPINVGGDGVFQINTRIGDSSLSLTSRERQYSLVSSEPYLLVCNSSYILGGLEDICDPDYISQNCINVEPGRYVVTVSLIDWKADPSSIDQNGNPSNSALPDFVILISPETRQVVEYRTKVITFDRS